MAVIVIYLKNLLEKKWKGSDRNLLSRALFRRKVDNFSRVVHLLLQLADSRLVFFDFAASRLRFFYDLRAADFLVLKILPKLFAVHSQIFHLVCHNLEIKSLATHEMIFFHLSIDGHFLPENNIFRSLFL